MASAGKKLTFVELADVETQVFGWGRLSWLSEPRLTAAKRFSAGIVVLQPGQGHDRHNHPGTEEILYVISGKGKQVVETPDGREEREVGPGVLIHLPDDVFHSTINTGNEPMNILAVYAPPGPEAALREMADALEPPKR